LIADIDSGSALIWAAYLAAGPAALAAFAAWRNSVVMKRQLKPSNGKTLAQTIERTQRDVQQVKTDLAYHISVQHGRGPIPEPLEEP
jgi:hypothetical protein